MINRTFFIAIPCMFFFFTSCLRSFILIINYLLFLTDPTSSCDFIFLPLFWLALPFMDCCFDLDLEAWRHDNVINALSQVFQEHNHCYDKKKQIRK